MMEWSLPAIAAQKGASLQNDPRYVFTDRLANLVIPTTDTPGASAAEVAVFVLLSLDRHLGNLDPAMLTTVTNALNAAAGGDFLKQPAARQEQLLAALDAAAYDKNPAERETPEFAWRGVKATIVGAYCTSKIGATQELMYLPVPGSFRSIRLTSKFRNDSSEEF